MNNKHILIIGAGPCGLGASWRLNELGYTEYQVIEANNSPGGLAASFVDDQGFTWDIGGHVLHSHYPYFDTVFEHVMNKEYFTHKRESWVWISDCFIPYPFQNNIHRLPGSLRTACLLGLKNRKRENNTPKTFADWIYSSYGDGIAKTFLIPYNQKIWAYPLEKMNTTWVGDRVAPVDVTRIEENIRLNRDDTAWGPNAVFHFPRKGGTGELWKRVAQRASKNIEYNKKVSRIDAKKKIVYCLDGSMYTYDVLFSTISIKTLVTFIDGISNIPDVSKLHFSSVTVVGIGVKGTVPSHLSSKCWMYFPDPTIPFFRTTVFSNYSPFNTPPGHWSLMMEVASSTYTPLPVGDIIGQCIKGARKVKLIDRENSIVDTFSYTASPGYPTPTLNRDSIIDPAVRKLEAFDIYTRGRFGLWKYEISNQDHTFMQGVEWVNSIVSI